MSQDVHASRGRFVDLPGAIPNSPGNIGVKGALYLVTYHHFSLTLLLNSDMEFHSLDSLARQYCQSLFMGFMLHTEYMLGH